MKKLITQLKRQKRMVLITICIITFMLTTITTYAAGGDTGIAPMENLQTWAFTLVRAIGILFCIMGGMAIANSIKAQDPSGRTQGFVELASGLVLVFLKEIFILIGIL